MIPAFVLLVVVVVLLLLPCLPALSPRRIVRDKKCELEGWCQKCHCCSLWGLCCVFVGDSWTPPEGWFVGDWSRSKNMVRFKSSDMIEYFCGSKELQVSEFCSFWAIVHLRLRFAGHWLALQAAIGLNQAHPPFDYGEWRWWVCRRNYTLLSAIKGTHTHIHSRTQALTIWVAL